MKKMLLLCCSLSVMVALHAQIIHVPTDYPTIQHGINAANPGDTVLVADSIYYEQIDFLGKKPLVVASEYLLDGDTSHINNTIIDGSQLTNLNNASLVNFISGEDSTSILCGFTIRNGKGTIYSNATSTYRAGGGIFISSSGAKIIHNHITENHVSNVFSGNAQTVTGAGIGSELDSGNDWVVISDNFIDQNSCTSNDLGAEGGGISLYYNSRITGNTISGNTCTGLESSYAVGAGFSCGMDVTTLTNVTAIVENNIISNNFVTAQNNFSHSAAGVFLIVKGELSNNMVENNVVNTNQTGGGGCAVLFWIPKEGCVARNNTFRGNTSNNIGCLGIQTPDTYPNPKTVLIENNYFIDNNAIYGGAIHLLRNRAIIQNNVFSRNNATQKGGAVYFAPGTGAVSSEHKVTFVNNSFFGNKSYQGGAIYALSYTVKPLIINSVFWGDTATIGREIYLEYSHDTVEIANSNINPALIYGCFRDGGGNINTDPLFTDFIKLTPLYTSPIVNAGTVAFTCACGDSHICPQYDILGLPRPWGTSPVDMGAYEFTDFDGLHPKSTAQIATYPNPFTNSVTISYTNDKAGPVLLQIFDSFGRLIAEPVNAVQLQGEQKIEWNAGNLPAGIYYCRLQSGEHIISNKIIKM